MFAPPPPESQLCDVCCTIDFATYFQPPVEGEPSTQNRIGMELFKRRDLGTSKQLRQKSSLCPFCYLAFNAPAKTSDDAVLSMSSIVCGRNRDEKGMNIQVAYYIEIVSDLRGTVSVGHIQLMAENACLIGLPLDFLARVPNENGFNMAQAREWLECCQTTHGSLCETLGGNPEEEPPPLQPLDLLAIDLVEICICHMPQGSEYIALSYCWPAKTYLTLEQKNYAELFEHHALLDRMDTLPGTIQDAIRCAQELPFRYLWIDALCIVQDDFKHKEAQLRQMDRVYGCASLTLVCAYPVMRGSDDPCDGFPGYGKYNAARKRIVRQVNGLGMMLVSPGVDDYLLLTRWYTRCWTYQEHQLSCRLLYFTPVQVYFQCSCSVFCEDIVCESIGRTAYIPPGNTIWSSKSRHLTAEEDSNWGGWELSRKPLTALSHMWESYEMALSYYTHRNVSYPSDILKAFEGVKAVLSDAFKTDFWQGIPEKILAQALCWQLKGSFYRRRNRPVGQPPSKPLFPSWTWAGWDSQVDLNTYIVTKAYRVDGEWFIVNDKSVATRLDVHPHWISAQSQRPSSSVIRPFLPCIVPRNEIDAKSEDWRDARTLACWTTRASLVLDGSIHQLSTIGHERLYRESTNFAIKDAYGVTAGCILLPKTFLEDFGVNSLRCEFILISRSLVTETKMSYFDESVYKSKDWCYLNVMLISRPSHLDEYEALRVGVGVVHQDAWVAAKPETDFVKLV